MATTAPALPLHDRIALVTGSSRGIGRAIARRLAQDGARVVVHCRGNREAARLTAEEIARLGPEPDPLVLAADVRSPNEVCGLFARIAERYGRLDLLVSNAAMGGFGPLLESKPHIWSLTLEASARALLLCAQKAVPLMAQGGRIVAISSTGSRRHVPNYGLMAAAKASLESMSRTLAVELGPLGILVNVVSGGLVETETLKFIPGSDALLSSARQKTPLGRIGTPDDLASVVAWLCGPGSAWVCGQVIVADGGASLLMS